MKEIFLSIILKKSLKEVNTTNQSLIDLSGGTSDTAITLLTLSESYHLS